MNDRDTHRDLASPRPGARIRDGTGQDFLDPTRPVNFKIIVGWPAGRPVFTEGFCSLFNVSNEKFLKWGGMGDVLKFVTLDRGLGKKMTRFKDFFG